MIVCSYPPRRNNANRMNLCLFGYENQHVYTQNDRKDISAINKNTQQYTAVRKHTHTHINLCSCGFLCSVGRHRAVHTGLIDWPYKGTFCHISGRFSGSGRHVAHDDPRVRMHTGCKHNPTGQQSRSETRQTVKLNPIIITFSFWIGPQIYTPHGLAQLADSRLDGTAISSEFSH